MTPHAWCGFLLGLVTTVTAGCASTADGIAPEGSHALQPSGLANGDIWRGLERHELQLGQKLLVVRGPRGVIGCPYLDIGVFEALGEACAIIAAADTAGMLGAKVLAVTTGAKALGIDVGMSGREALDRIR